MYGLFQAPRALTVQSAAIAQIAGQPALVPLKLEGVEGINRLFEYRLALQTPNALNFTGGQGSNFELDDFIGKEITCFIELEGHGSFVAGALGGVTPNQGAGVREISALITDARYIGQDNRHSLYELTLRPWLHLATLTTDCKVFQDQTPVQVIEAVLADYPFAADKRLIETYPVRDYCVQYNETDFEFVTRLMQEWGINYHWEHSGGVHRLLWSDHNGAFQVTQRESAQGKGTGSSAYHQIPFYPLGHKIDREYIHGFSPTSRVTSGSFESRDYDYTRPKATLATNDAAPRNTGHADGDVYLWRGDRPNIASSDYSQPNKGADKAANQTEPQGKHLARLRMQALRQSGNRASGVGHVRGIVPGCTFTLSEHPQEKANAEYIVLDTRFLIENNPPSPPPLTPAGVRGALNSPFGGVASAALSSTGASDLVGSGLIALSDAERLAGHWRVHVAFEVQPTSEALRPQANQRKPKTGGPETALVVGPDADTAESNIYTDSLGRIKVQFPWDRYGQKNQNSSCWVRVSSSWAGNQLGAMHVPRIGQEVIVDFLGGDPDLPIATGRVYNQLNTPPWSLPEQQALSGFRSRELNPGAGNSAGGRSNHLILDDTKEKIQAQLKSDHQHSQLSLGHITRIEDNQGRKDYRGEGFELRTDGHGAIRAKDGLLISTEARSNAHGHVKSMTETAARLQDALEQHEDLGDLALQHDAQTKDDQPSVSKTLASQNQAISGKSTVKAANDASFPELNAPHLVLASPAGIATTTPGSTHQHSGQHHAITSAGHTSISAGRSFLVSAKKAIKAFSFKGGIKLVSAKENVEIQALRKSVNMIAKFDITHTAERISINGKKFVQIEGGGSYVRWDGSITGGTTGSYVAHAGSHGLPAGKSGEVVMPRMAFVPEPSEYSARIDASPIQTALYLPDDVRNMTVLNVTANESDVARITGFDQTRPNYIFAASEKTTNVLMKSCDAWAVESEFVDLSDV